MHRIAVAVQHFVATSVRYQLSKAATAARWCSCTELFVDNTATHRHRDGKRVGREHDPRLR